MAGCVPTVEQQCPWWQHSNKASDLGYWHQYRRGAANKNWNLVRMASMHEEATELCRAPDDPLVILGDDDAAGSTFWSIGTVKVSPDGRWLAYTVDTVGSELYQLRLKNINDKCPAAQAADDGHTDPSVHSTSTASQVIAEGCGPHVEWLLNSEGIVATQLTMDTREIHKVVVYDLHKQPGSPPAGHTTMTVMDISLGQTSCTAVQWMGTCSDSQYLALRASHRSDCEIRLIPIAATAARTNEQGVGSVQQRKMRDTAQAIVVSESIKVDAGRHTAAVEPMTHNVLRETSFIEACAGQDAAVSDNSYGVAAYHIAIPWQNEWDVHQVEVFNDIVIALIDTDAHPDGCIVALPAAWSRSAADRTGHEPAVRQNQQREQQQLPPHHEQSICTFQDLHEPPSASGAVQLEHCQHAGFNGLDGQHHHVMLVPGSREYELRHMEVVTCTASQERFLAVTRVEKLITHVDIYSVPTAGHHDGLWMHLTRLIHRSSTAPRNIGECIQQQPHGAGPGLQLCFTYTPVDAYAHVSMSKARISVDTYSAMFQPVSREAAGCVDVLSIAYSTLVQPTKTMYLDCVSGKRACVHVEEVPDYTHEPLSQGFTCDLQWAASFDGAQIPFTLAYNKSAVKLDGCSPCILHVYGAYGNRQDPSFNPLDLPLLQRGVIIAVAHVRGGGEMGSSWHKAGRLHNKPNTFADVRAVVKDLCHRGFTSRDHIALWGRSAGGLAVAASITEEPTLCRAAVLNVPFLDVLTPMCDPSLPLTVKERREWGDPLASQEMRAMIESYSPYHTLDAAVHGAWKAATETPTRANGNYKHNQQRGGSSSWWWPHMYITASAHDSRVPAWIPARYVTKLKELVNDIKAKHEAETSSGSTTQVGQVPCDPVSTNTAASSTNKTFAHAAQPTVPHETSHRSADQKNVHTMQGQQERSSSGCGSVAWPHIVMVTDMESGHAGSSDACNRLRDRADKLAFVLSYIASANDHDKQ